MTTKTITEKGRATVQRRGSHRAELHFKVLIYLS